MKYQAFYEVFSSWVNKKHLKIPREFLESIEEGLPEKVTLKDRYNNKWEVDVVRLAKDKHFVGGWIKFAQDNLLKHEDLLVFEYIRKGLFVVKIFGRSKVEKEGLGQNAAQDLGNGGGVSHDNVTDNTDGDDDEDDDYDVVKEGGKGNDNDNDNDVVMKNVDVKEENVDEEGRDINVMQESNCGEGDSFATQDINTEEDANEEDINYTTEDGTDDEDTADESYNIGQDVDEDDTNTACMMEDQENEQANKESSSRKAPPKSQLRALGYIRKRYGVDIFRAGMVRQPQNHYFVANIKENRRCYLIIPKDVIESFSIDLTQQEMRFVDPNRREYRAKCKAWKDGRVAISGGWSKLCSINLVEEGDCCVCEFAPSGDGRLLIKVSFLRDRPCSS